MHPRRPLAATVALVLGLLLPGAAAVAAELTGRPEQGGLVVGRTAPGARVTLDGRPVRVDPQGRFVVGFNRDHPAAAELAEDFPDGRRSVTALTVTPRQWDIQRIDGLPPQKVTPDPKLQERIREENARIAAVRKSDRPDPDLFGGFVPPVQGETRISGVFGSQRILNGEARSPHSGTDYAAPEGTPVVATGPGKISLAEDDLFFTGKTVMIDHGFGLQSVYAHLSRFDVSVGQRVEPGQVIGAVGATGRATGPHLHFGLSWFDERLDPETALPLLFRAGE